MKTVSFKCICLIAIVLALFVFIIEEVSAEKKDVSKGGVNDKGSNASSPDATDGTREDRGEQECEERIEKIFKEILEDLKKQDVHSPDTVYLKSGKELHCTILEESDIGLKIRYRGITITKDRDDIERVESKAPETVEAELREMALAQARRIVDKNLVRYGREWVSLEEKARRIQAAKMQKKTGEPKTSEEIDSDQDGLSDNTELEIGTDIQNPDTDGDGLLDGLEFQNNSDPMDRDSVYEFKLSFPIEGGWSEDAFGYQSFLDHDSSANLSDYECGARTYDGHTGYDVCASHGFRETDEGITIVAAASGIVREVADGFYDRWDSMKNDENNQKSNYVLIDHGNGLSTSYHHMKKDSIPLRRGQVVYKGQRIGLMGSSGKSGTPHLHFEVFKDGQPVDPFAGSCNKSGSLWDSQPPYTRAPRFLEGLLLDFQLDPKSEQWNRFNRFLEPEHYVNGYPYTDDFPFFPFTLEDREIIYVFRYLNLSSGDRIQTEFIDPTGKTFQRIEHYIEKEYPYFCRYIQIPLKDHIRQPGIWMVAQSLNGNITNVENFFVRAPDPVYYAIEINQFSFSNKEKILLRLHLKNLCREPIMDSGLFVILSIPGLGEFYLGKPYNGDRAFVQSRWEETPEHLELSTGLAPFKTTYLDIFPKFSRLSLSEPEGNWQVKIVYASDAEGIQSAIEQGKYRSVGFNYTHVADQ